MEKITPYKLLLSPKKLDLTTHYKQNITDNLLLSGLKNELTADNKHYHIFTSTISIWKIFRNFVVIFKFAE